MNTLRILEISWLVFGIAGIILCFYNIVTEGVSSAILPLVFTFIAGVFYMVRRKQRISYQKHQQHSETNQE
jgi:UPF0716 family protein affecting phage T7 exclusion